MTALGAVVGTAIDQLAGEPPVAWHPVARYGTAMRTVEERLYRDRRATGVAHVAVGVGIAATAGYVTRRALGRHVSTALAVAICAAGAMLDDEAHAMAALLRDEDLAAARERVRSLVGRDAVELDAGELSRAVIESVAENLVDAVTATLWWGAVLGPVGALGHRAVNTLDAMVGHHDDRYEHFGWASARLDDVVNYVPARLTAVAVAVARPHRACDVWRIVRRDARRHPSPNGGVVEAAFAAALGVTLGGVNRYDGTVEDRGALGDGGPPSVDSIGAAIRLRRHVTAIAAVALGVAGAAGASRRRDR
ncbi:MAG: adenosylcobinamide-phosphate synthase CbiB [Acidimicrobiia bacterium]